MPSRMRRLHRGRAATRNVVQCSAASLVVVVRKLVECAEQFFANSGRYNNASGDGALIAVLEERVFDDELRPYVRECF